MFDPLIPTYNPVRSGLTWNGVRVCPLPPNQSASQSARCRANPIGSFSPSIAVLLQSGVEAVDQGFSGEGLGQEAGRSCLQSSHASVLDRESRDEDERHAVSL